MHMHRFRANAKEMSRKKNWHGHVDRIVVPPSFLTWCAEDKAMHHRMALNIAKLIIEI
jgi:hypothetical protein